MSIALRVYFTEYGEPKTGLSPTVRIRDCSDNSLVVTDAAMTEIGDGWYKYTFASYDYAKDYVARADGGSGQPIEERYAPVDMPSAAIAGEINSIVSDVLSGVVEGTLTLKQVLAVLLAKAAGAGEGGGTTTLLYKNQAGDTDRITYSVTGEYGNRTTAIDVSDL